MCIRSLDILFIYIIESMITSSIYDNRVINHNEHVKICKRTLQNNNKDYILRFVSYGVMNNINITL